MTVNISFIHDQPSLSHSNLKPAGESRELVDVLQKIVRNAGALLGVQQCSLALLDPTGTALVTLAALQEAGQKPRQSKFQRSEGVAGWVAEHREPLVINDVSQDARFKRLGRVPIGSMLCVPLLNSEQFIGTLTVSSQEKDAFEQRMVQMLTIFAEQAVLAITNARHAEMAQHQADQLEMLMRLSRGITARLDPESLYRTILANVRRLLPCEQATILLYQAGIQELHAVAQWTASEEHPFEDGHGIIIFDGRPGSLDKQERISMYSTSSVSAWAAVHMHPMLSAALPRQPLLDAFSQESTLSELATPFVSKDMLYGVLSLKRKEPFSSEELRLMRNLGYIVAASLENVELFHKVRTDQEQLRAILASSSDGIALLNAGNCFVETNASFERIFGLEAGQALGMECMELLSSGDEGGPTAEDWQRIQGALDQKKSLPYIEIDLKILGVMRAIGLSFTPVSTKGQALYLLIARDVTAIRDATRLKANFLSMITHELRSPLNAINGYLDLTLNDIAGEINTQQREFLQRARAGSEHLFTLIEDLLLIARADSGQLALKRQVINLQDVTTNATEEMELTAIDGGVDLVVDVPPDFPRMYADAGRLQQVLRNLLSNALHFTPSGGQITISASVEENAASERALDPDESPRVVKLRVRDTGSGIPLEFQQRIFDRFYQIPSSTSGRAGGQGLGLAIVKMIVELHGGSIAVESAPGEGSTFTCILPCLLT